MVYVGGPHQADVFFSYAHGGVTKLRKWSLRIPDELRQEICTSLSLKSGVTIFHDPDLDRAGKFAAELEANARGAAVFLIILSKYYIESCWCAKERQWFIEALKHNGRDDDLIFVVHALPTERNELPPELRGRIGYNFHDVTKAKSNSFAVRPFGWTNSTHDDLETEIVALAGDIANRLKRIKERNETVQATFAGYRTKDDGAIYLHARREDENAWCHTANLLSKRFAVVPGAVPAAIPDPAAREREHRERVAQCAGCDALLLLRSRPGNWIDTDLMSVGRGLSQEVYGFRQEMDLQRAAPIPCAVLDLVCDPLPLAERWGIPRLPTTSASMTDDIAQWLKHIRRRHTQEAAPP